MNFALDILLVCIVIVFVIVGVKRGFIKSAAHFLGAIAAACLSAALGRMAAQWLYDTLFHEALVEKISGTIGSMGTAEAVRNVLGSLPDFIIRALEDAGITEAALKGGVASQTGQTAELLAASLEPVFVGFLKVLTVIALFLLFMVVVRILANVVSAAFELPVLSQLNGLLGGVFGLLLGLLSVWVVLAALKVFLPMLSSDMQLQIENWLQQSVVAGTFVGANPLTGMFR